MWVGGGGAVNGGKPHCCSTLLPTSPSLPKILGVSERAEAMPCKAKSQTMPFLCLHVHILSCRPNIQVPRFAP